jgi:predicted ATPase/DNA-binding SARP family transcriptional activator
VTSANTSTNFLVINVLGTFCIKWDSQPVRLPTQKIENLLVFLLLHPGIHSREKLATLFWGESPHENARRSLRQALTILRSYFGEQLILSDRESVRIDQSFPINMDLWEFVEKAQLFMNDLSITSDPFDSTLYPDDLLIDWYDDWLLSLREYYRKIYIDVMLRSVELLRTQSEYHRAIYYAQQILKIDATNERSHQHLMFCFITTGNRDHALRQYETCQRVLQEELNVQPTLETTSLYYWIKESVSSVPSQAAKITNLPIPISSFIGRSQELTQIKQLLSTRRLVCLTGAGGSGKTRLAIHAATDLIDAYHDGIWWVEFASVTEPSLVPAAVARALGMEVKGQTPVIEAILKFLHKRQLLLVLDNCEHLIDAIAKLVTILLNNCERLKILATSRESLGVMGELVWTASTLPVPEEGKISLVNIAMQYEAVQLFVERTSAILPGYKLSETDAVPVSKICQRVDGIPLAIELAAARMKIMSAEQIETRLDDLFTLHISSSRTMPDRHRTLRATLDWSYELLSEEEQNLFCRLSVFSEGWTIEAAESVCSGKGIEQRKILELLAHLVDKSLITKDRWRARYRMLETMKAYTRQRLMEKGEFDWVLQCYLDYLLKLAEMADEKIRGPEQLYWLERVKQEEDNLTGALEWSLNNDANIRAGINIVCALTWYWATIGEFITARYWFEQALGKSERLGRTATRAKILFNAGFLSAFGLYYLNPSEQQDVIGKSLDIWDELGSDYTVERGKCLFTLGFIQKTDFDDKRGFELFNEGVEIFKSTEQTWWQAWALNISVMMRNDASVQEIRSILQEEAFLWKKVGDRSGLAIQMMDLGVLAMEEGDFIEAERYLLDSLSIFKELGSKGYLFQILRDLGTVKWGLKQYKHAENYYKECIPFAQMIGWDFILAIIYLRLGFVLLDQNKIIEAGSYLTQALVKSGELDRKKWLILCVGGFAALAVKQNLPSLAARWMGAFIANNQLNDEQPDHSHKQKYPLVRMEIDLYQRLCREKMAAETFKQAWNSGHALTLDEAIEEISRIHFYEKPNVGNIK